MTPRAADQRIADVARAGQPPEPLLRPAPLRARNGPRTGLSDSLTSPRTVRQPMAAGAG